MDLEELAMALDDQSAMEFGSSWWIDPATGAILLDSDATGVDEIEGDPEDSGLIPIDPQPSYVAYNIMSAFVERLPDGRARDRLSRAIEGRGAFRRFKNALHDYEELVGEWHAFHDVRQRRRAIDWLADNDLISGSDAQRARERYPDPPAPN